MAFSDLLRRHRFLAVALAGSVVGVVVGLFLPIRAADPPDAEEAAWSLPNAQALKRYRDEHFQAVRRARFWGAVAMPGQRAASQPSMWSLHAIVTRPIVQVAVSANGKPGQSWVRVGGALPDGSILVAVTRDRAWYDKDGCRRVRALYKDSSKTDVDACIGAPRGDDAMASPKPPAASAPRAPAAAAGKPH